MEKVKKPSVKQRRFRCRVCAPSSEVILGLTCLGLVFVWAFSLAVNAQQPKPSEYQVKAAYLYNFSRFVEWPGRPAAESSRPFAICVLGKDPFGSILDTTVSGQGAGPQNLVARRLTKPQDALACQILFVGDSEEGHLKEIMMVLGKANVLTVSDIPRFSERGGMIGFVLKGDRVRFEVNLTNAVNAGLAVSSDLLKVALAVKKNPQSGV